MEDKKTTRKESVKYIIGHEDNTKFYLESGLGITSDIKKAYHYSEEEAKGIISLYQCTKIKVEPRYLILSKDDYGTDVYYLEYAHGTTQIMSEAYAYSEDELKSNHGISVKERLSNILIRVLKLSTGGHILFPHDVEVDATVDLYPERITSDFFTNTYVTPYIKTHTPPSDKVEESMDEQFNEVTKSIADLLIYKNEKYGNAALDPMNVFQGKCKVGQRLDDKLARVKNGDWLKKNDVADLIGYLTLVCVENNWRNFDEFKD